MVLSVVALTTFTLATKNTLIIVNSAQQYFFCELSGHDPSNPCNRSEFEKLTNPSVTTLSYILMMALFPVVNLVYIVNIEELKQLWRKCLAKKKNVRFNSSSAENTIAMTPTLRRVPYS